MVFWVTINTTTSTENELRTIKLRRRKVEKHRFAIIRSGMDKRKSNSIQ
jgi:hypothetical protein